MSIHWLTHYQRGGGQGASRHTGRQTFYNIQTFIQTFYNTVDEVKAEVVVIKVPSRIAVLRGKPHEDRLTKV